MISFKLTIAGEGSAFTIAYDSFKSVQNFLSGRSRSVAKYKYNLKPVTRNFKMFRSRKDWFLLKFFLLTVLKFKMSLGTRECCPPSYYLIEKSKMCSDNKSSINLNCKHGALLLDPSENENDEFSLRSSGTLAFFDGEERSHDEFCLGKIQRNKTETSENLVALICFDDDWQQLDFVSIILRVLMLISTLFLLITLYIYIVLPNLKDLQGKCVIAFVCCLIASYITLLVIQTFPNSSHIACVIQATSLYFFMSATFFWNNIITFNIWKTIRCASYKITENSCLIIYTIWGFGFPLIMVILSFILEHIPEGNHVRPRFGETRCWFKGKLESWSYFYGPISIILVLNTVMFLQSIWTLWKSYRASNISKLKSLRFKCMMYLKLFLLMGISWTFEVISYAASSHESTKYIWFVTDCLNSAQGVLMFLILVVFRQKVRLGLLKKKLLKINWPQSWAKEEVQESSTASMVENLELANQKSKMINESQK